MLMGLAAVICLLLPGCTQLFFGDGSYTGPDAGMLILSMSADGECPPPTYILRLRTTDGAVQPALDLRAVDRLETPTDLEGRDRLTSVLSRRMAPGSYEIFDAILFRTGGSGSDSWTEVRPLQTKFMISFTIEPHAATYIGNWSTFIPKVPSPTSGSYCGSPVGSITDQSARDLAIAKGKVAVPAKVNLAVPTGLTRLL